MLRVYVVFVAFSWGKAFFVAVAFSSVICSACVPHCNIYIYTYIYSATSELRLAIPRRIIGTSTADCFEQDSAEPDGVGGIFARPMLAE